MAAVQSAVQPKRIYFAQRHASLDRGAFIARWRRHGKLAMHFMAAQHWENVLRYVHCDAVRDAALAGIDEQWDGMGILLFRAAAARRRHIGVPAARAALEADEDATFAERVSRNGLVAREELLRDGPAAGVKLVRVFRRREGVGADEFERWWRECHVPAAGSEAGPRLRRYAANWPLPPEHPGGWGLECDVIEELWFDTLEALRAVVTGHPGFIRSCARGADSLDFDRDDAGVGQHADSIPDTPSEIADCRLAIVVSETRLYPPAETGEEV